MSKFLAKFNLKREITTTSSPESNGEICEFFFSSKPPKFFLHC